jgi:hypothetical protein
MNYLEFVAAIISALAWPVAAVVLLAILRSPLKRVLLGLTRVKYKDIEIDFGRELSKIEAQARSIELKPVPVRQEAAPKDSAELLREASRLAEELPEPAVAVGWSAVELDLQAAAARLALAPDRAARTSPARMIALLRNGGHLDDQMHEILSRMRNLRNMAVHRHQGAGPVSSDEAREFLALAGGVIERLGSLRPAPKS